jgi:hypothetical protein
MLERYPDRRFTAYGADAAYIAAMRERFTQWCDQLLTDEAKLAVTSTEDAGRAGMVVRQSKVPRPYRRQHCLYLRPDPHQHGAIRSGGQGTIAVMMLSRFG